MSLVTTLPAPTITLFPIVISPIIQTFAPTVTLSPIIGPLLFLIVLLWKLPSARIMIVSPLLPNVSEWRCEKFLPIRCALNIVAKE